MEIRYPAVFEPQEGGGFHVQFVDLPDTFTCGQDKEECLFNAAEVLAAMIEIKLKDGDPIPSPTPGLRDAFYIAPSAKVQAALLVRFTRGARPLSEVARALNTSWPAAQRLEDPGHWPSLKTLDKAATALGKRLVLRFE